MPSRINSGISSNNNNYGNQYRPKQNLPSIKNERYCDIINIILLS